MGTKFFGQYLIDKKIIAGFDLVRVMKFQEKNNLSFGELVIKMDMMTKDQVAQINEAQRHEDLQFGDLALKLGFLTADEVTRVLNLQRNQHVYLGEALVALGALTRKELDSHLKQFHQEKEVLTANETSFPLGINHHPVKEIIVDIVCKMLTRMTTLAYHIGPGQFIEHYSGRPVTLQVQFKGTFNGRLFLGLSEKTRILLAIDIVNDGTLLPPSLSKQNEILFRFTTLLTDNIISKAEQMGYKLETSAIHLHHNEILNAKSNSEKGLLFLVHLPDGEVIDIVILT